MGFLDTVLGHISETAKVPSFSTYEERLHPYIERVMRNYTDAEKVAVPGNNLIFRLSGHPANAERTVALAAHLDKINHYGPDFPDELPVRQTPGYIEGAMDDCTGLGILLGVAEKSTEIEYLPSLLFFFSEMEESKGLKEHPELLKGNGRGYNHGMGARRIGKTCIEQEWIPDEIITLDTTPLFKGKQGVALYSKH